MVRKARLFVAVILGHLCSAFALKTHWPGGNFPQQSEGNDLLQAAMPINWLHIAKTGSSLLTTLIHLPGVCPGVPEDYITSNAPQFTKDFGPEACNASAFDMALWDKVEKITPIMLYSAFPFITNSEHNGLEAKVYGGFEKNKGHFITFLRQPEQLFLSLRAYMVNGGARDVHWLAGLATMPYAFYSLERQKREWAGMLTKMFTRPSFVIYDTKPPTRAEMEEAKYRLRTGFFFFGFTEKWNLSMCLFNKMFNIVCRTRQFRNSHPSNRQASVLYDTRELKGWRDPYDNELYDYAQQLFAAKLRQYGVDEQSCTPCYRQAGLID